MINYGSTRGTDSGYRGRLNARGPLGRNRANCRGDVTTAEPPQYQRVRLRLTARGGYREPPVAHFRQLPSVAAFHPRRRHVRWPRACNNRRQTRVGIARTRLQATTHIPTEHLAFPHYDFTPPPAPGGVRSCRAPMLRLSREKRPASAARPLTLLLSRMTHSLFRGLQAERVRPGRATMTPLTAHPSQAGRRSAHLPHPNTVHRLRLHRRRAEPTFDSWTAAFSLRTTTPANVNLPGATVPVRLRGCTPRNSIQL